MTETIAELVRKVDLLALMERDLGEGKPSGRWILFSCPFPGHAHGDKSPSLAVTPDNGRYFCFACKTSGDAYTWLRKYRKLDHQAAMEALGGGVIPALATPRPAAAPPAPQPAAEPPPAIWQAQALRLVESCERALWEPGGARALAWLRGRGLQDKTIKRFRLGYNPADNWPAAKSWGSPGDKPEPLAIPRGILIPCLLGGACWYAKIRRPVGQPKYQNIRGGRPALFGADTATGADTLLLTEGELDAVLAWQELKEYAGVATLGSATKKLDLATWGNYLLPARLILAAYDLDKAGEGGAASLASLSGRVHCLPVPRLRAGDKDITDYYKAGGNLADWLNYHLDRIDPQPGGMVETGQALGAVVRPYGDALLESADQAAAAGDLATWAQYWAAAMQELQIEPTDGIPWESWAASYAVPA